jgi:hypothetical protein
MASNGTWRASGMYTNAIKAVRPNFVLSKRLFSIMYIAAINATKPIFCAFDARLFCKYYTKRKNTMRSGWKHIRTSKIRTIIDQHTCHTSSSRFKYIQYLLVATKFSRRNQPTSTIKRKLKQCVIELQFSSNDFHDSSHKICENIY